ncbi:hypothetical protein HS048_33445 [Planomonospora sp. ID91781]|uniref:hypothetical protein n=1 Tax=Planomonospora sp. ID91781 TaxID=2738135 RepID=UPI0018C36CFC|nr:hypothetical protein [Planomonospora sp. ID91781]MBG0825593.1 hypothetical protein [Planomonospora sp. ID91781]
MLSKRIASAFAAAAVTGSGLVALTAVTAAPAHAQEACLYQVRNVAADSYLKVRKKPGKTPKSWNKRHKTIDVLYPGQVTTGNCKRSRENWRKVFGDSGVEGHVHKAYVKKGPRITTEETTNGS